MNLRYCTGTGSLKPILIRLPSITAGVQLRAQVRVAGSIGEAKKMRNVVALMTTSMTTTETNRRRM